MIVQIIRAVVLVVYALLLGVSVSAITALLATSLQRYIDYYIMMHPDSFLSYLLNLLFSPPVVLITGILSTLSVLIGLKYTFLLSLLVLVVAIAKERDITHQRNRMANED